MAVAALLGSPDGLDGVPGSRAAQAAESAPGTQLAGSASAAGEATALQAARCPAPVEDFGQWLQAFRGVAVANGIPPAVAERALAGVRRNTTIEEKDSFQPEFERPVWDYLASAVSDTRVSRGRALLEQNRPMLQRVQAEFGVQPEYVVAIWGIESSFGAVTGGYNILESLANLGFSGRRRQFGCAELMAALRFLASTNTPPSRLVGSWAGATGQTQFLPSTILRYGIDFDRSGGVDLWTSLADIFASTANHLTRANWVPGQPWGIEVDLPADFDWMQARPDHRKSIDYWRTQGVKRVNGKSLPALSGDLAVLVPAGHRGPAFLITDNFRAIMQYNFSTSYALAVGVLADRVAGRPGVSANWPVDQKPLTRGERMELQERLLNRGYPIGTLDGVVGRQTRIALQAYQRDIAVPADGFATQDLLRRLRVQ